MEVFDTHKFLFTLNHNKNIEGHIVLFIDRDNNEKKIELSKIEIGSSPVSCKLFDKDNNRYIVPFIRILKIFYKDELVWDNSETDRSNIKVIKGYD